MFITEIIEPHDLRDVSFANKKAIHNEVRGIWSRGCFLNNSLHDVDRDANILSGLFVLTLKNDRIAEERSKAQLVAQGHTDFEKSIIVQDSASLKYSSLRMILS